MLIEGGRMGATRVIVALFLAITFLSYQVSARQLHEDADLGTRSPRKAENFEPVVQDLMPIASSQRSDSKAYEHLAEIDRFKLSINKLICDTMEEGCDHMDDSADHSDTTYQTNESFSTLNPHDHVREY